MEQRANVGRPRDRAKYGGKLNCSAFEQFGQHHDLHRVDFLHALVVGQKKSGIPLNGCGDLQSIGQADRVACAKERRRFSQLFVHRNNRKRSERVERELDFVGEREILSVNGLVRISATVTAEVTACTA